MSPLPHFTPRELQVLNLMANGKHNNEIAAALSVSEHTAKFHVNSVLVKTGQTTRLAATIFCLKNGLISLFDLMPEITPSFMLTCTAMAILEQDKDGIREQKRNMRENIVNDIMEHLMEFTNLSLYTTGEKKEDIQKELNEILTAYIPDA